MKRLFLLIGLIVPYWLTLPGGDGPAFLDSDSFWPIVYALCSLGLFGLASWWLFDLDSTDRVDTLSRLCIGGIGGIAILCLLNAAKGHIALADRYFGAPAGLVFSLFGLTSFFAESTSVPMWLSIVGYTVNVGLTEEAAKAIAARTDVHDRLRTRAALGFCSGIGFGVAEALIYSSDYAGSADWTLYLVRFVFCVGLHGAMSGMAVLLLPEDWWEIERWWYTALCLLPIAFLHGAYDALLMRDQSIWAGVVATFTVAVLPVWVWVQEEMVGEA